MDSSSKKAKPHDDDGSLIDIILLWSLEDVFNEDLYEHMVYLLADPKSRRSCLYSLFPTVSLLCLLFFIGSTFIVTDYKVFPSSDFVIMLFHYDGAIDAWRDLEWSDRAIHVPAVNQTKWNLWFAKHFLHPDIVANYDYIFLWDEDLEVENFHTGRYILVVKEEGLHISQPTLDATKSEVHHQITVRGRRSRVYRRTYKLTGGRSCESNSTGPPCTGWVEMMAPVFSREAWRCTWYMIQRTPSRTANASPSSLDVNRQEEARAALKLEIHFWSAFSLTGYLFCSQNGLIHAWGVDMQLSYCAQSKADVTKNSSGRGTPPPSMSHQLNDRYSVRKQSYIELEIFKN
ncbi:hypothetical protein GIB67_005299 [Kingdonia uniflora]|uniref:Uncharacterized protein n=1 Tax=Kingdonia uniflora TaxID=39325 RepID=A0A7J7LCY5_9MAGN|nr:hypothetical protein GIB67_005299 [Kingdonia uniflora]